MSHGLNVSPVILVPVYTRSEPVGSLLKRHNGVHHGEASPTLTGSVIRDIFWGGCLGHIFLLRNRRKGKNRKKREHYFLFKVHINRVEAMVYRITLGERLVRIPPPSFVFGLIRRCLALCAQGRAHQRTEAVTGWMASRDPAMLLKASVPVMSQLWGERALPLPGCHVGAVT